jgi:hypothetical protein
VRENAASTAEASVEYFGERESQFGSRVRNARVQADNGRSDRVHGNRKAPRGPGPERTKRGSFGDTTETGQPIQGEPALRKLARDGPARS